MTSADQQLDDVVAAMKAAMTSPDTTSVSVHDGYDLVTLERQPSGAMHATVARSLVPDPLIRRDLEQAISKSVQALLDALGADASTAMRHVAVAFRELTAEQMREPVAHFEANIDTIRQQSAAARERIARRKARSQGR